MNLTYFELQNGCLSRVVSDLVPLKSILYTMAYADPVQLQVVSPSHLMHSTEGLLSKPYYRLYVCL